MISLVENRRILPISTAIIGHWIPSILPKLIPTATAGLVWEAMPPDSPTSCFPKPACLIAISSTYCMLDHVCCFRHPVFLLHVKRPFFVLAGLGLLWDEIFSLSGSQHEMRECLLQAIPGFLSGHQSLGSFPSLGRGSTPMGSHFGVGEFTTHFRTYFSGD